MKKILLNLAFLGLFLPVISNAQTTSEVDAAKLEAKKKAEEEKAALPKPYNETEHAEANIAKLIKKAKKEIVKYTICLLANCSFVSLIKWYDKNINGKTNIINK